MRNIILIIDDDPVRTEPYILNLEMSLPDYIVKYIRQPGDAMPFIFEKSDEIFCIILDLMFPKDGPNRGGYDRGIDFYHELKNETNIEDGIDLYKFLKNEISVESYIKTMNIDRLRILDSQKVAKNIFDIKIIILTNRLRVDSVIVDFLKEMKKNGDYFYEKPYTLSTKLSSIIKDLINGKPQTN
jgi:hypothetical protein